MKALFSQLGFLSLASLFITGDARSPRIENEDMNVFTLFVGTDSLLQLGALALISHQVYGVEGQAETDEAMKLRIAFYCSSKYTAGGKQSAGLLPAGSLSAERLPVDTPSAETIPQQTVMGRAYRVRLWKEEQACIPALTNLSIAINLCSTVLGTKVLDQLVYMLVDSSLESQQGDNFVLRRNSLNSKTQQQAASGSIRPHYQHEDRPISIYLLNFTRLVVCRCSHQFNHGINCDQ
ncbi:hypothetical protein Tco_0345809 [Tanacetum coccineum]